MTLKLISQVHIPHFLARRGQSMVEYLVFFAVFAAVTVFVVGLLPNSRQNLEEHFQTAVRRITASR